MNSDFKRFTFVLSLITNILPALRAEQGKTIIIDSSHYSNVFGEVRNYRIFLPPDYYENPDKRYPVIYFYHGWSQRYFGSINSEGYDEGESNYGDNIANFVSTHDVIVVKPDGYNRKPDQEYYLRPYNISPVETYRQFPLYFPELVKHIDEIFKTIPDRNHRAISGLSMGGFMTYWISGKYPHLVSAAGNFCGSPEFFVGPENFPVEYRHIDMAKNYAGLNVRLNYGNKDFIRCYHRDLNRLWPDLMNNYTYKIYEAGHTTCGLGEMFAFIMDTFKNPPAKPAKWDHIDVYPVFEVWDYKISSDRDRPGFTIIENVDERGFRSSVREFLPDGELMMFVKLTVITSPVYEKNKLYIVNDINKKSFKCSIRKIISDNSGRLKIELDGGIHEIGINKTPDTPVLCVGTAGIFKEPWLIPRKETRLDIRLLNKGFSAAGEVKALLSSEKNNIKIVNGTSSYGKIGIGELRNGSAPFSIVVLSDTMEIVKVKLTIRAAGNNEWTDQIEIPVKKDLTDIPEFEIADGKLINVSQAGIDTVEMFLGSGNGDGIANPGESVVLLVMDQGIHIRTELYTADPYINPNGTNVRNSDNWSEYDHVGGSAKYSVPLISSECPQNHQIEFLSSYWLPHYPDHIIKEGKIKMKVTGKDITPPVIQWTKVSGDNIIQAKVADGSAISGVKAILTAGNDPSRTLEVFLKDEGLDGDWIKDDRLFSKKIGSQKFGLFRMDIEAVDSLGNKKYEKAEGLHVIH